MSSLADLPEFLGLCLGHSWLEELDLHLGQLPCGNLQGNLRLLALLERVWGRGTKNTHAAGELAGKDNALSGARNPVSYGIFQVTAQIHR